MTGDPSRIRTCNPRSRNPLLYPVELWDRRAVLYHCQYEKSASPATPSNQIAVRPRNLRDGHSAQPSLIRSRHSARPGAWR